MQAVKRQLRVPVDREIKIQLPADAVVETNVEVIVLYQNSSLLVAIDDDDDAEMARAAQDPLFMADLHEVMTDFQYADFDAILLTDFEQERP
jgi:hypothetical protein